MAKMAALGHAEHASRRAQGKIAYQPTAPKSGGLRQLVPDCSDHLCKLSAKRSIRILPVYRWYSKAPMISQMAGFDMLNLWSFAEADILIVDKMSDIDMVREEHLALCLFLMHVYNIFQNVETTDAQKMAKSISCKAAALLYCYGCGGVVATVADIEAYMQQPYSSGRKAASSILHFQPAIAKKRVGVKLNGDLLKPLGRR